MEASPFNASVGRRLPPIDLRPFPVEVSIVKDHTSQRTLSPHRSRMSMRVKSYYLLPLLLLCSTAFAKEYKMPRGEQQIIVDMHFLISAARSEHILRWLDSSTAALVSVYGRLPRSNLRIEVSPISVNSDDSIPWAQVTRGDPDTVKFYIDAMASEEDLVNNWTSYHELSHLLIPYRGWGDMWFSEGLASYYQNLLQVRAGVIDERTLWQKLHAGFERGLDNRRPDLTLAELSPTMRENRSYMRVYWSGAWFFLKADVELRKRSGGDVTLDTVLGELNNCCRDETLSAREIVVKLDSFSESTLFSDLFNTMRASRAIPPVEALWSELGIAVEGGTVSLIEEHPGARLRRGIAESSKL
ncbi:MAG: hypothetical protein AB8B81_15145 [Halioglobus sp.]